MSESIVLLDAAPASDRKARLDPRLWILFLGRLITSVGHSISFPFFAIYCHGTLGVSMTAVGGILFFSGLMGAFGEYLGGTWSDRIGRKRVMLAALSLRVVLTGAFGILALQPHPSLAGVALLFIASMWSGFLFEPACHAMVADLADPRLRVFGYSLYRIGGNLGFALGTAVGGFVGALSFAVMFFTTAGITLTALFVLALFVAESLPNLRPHAAAPAGRISDCLRVPGFLVLCLASLLISLVMTQLIAPMSAFAQDHLGLPPQRAGFLFALNGLIIVLFQIPAAKLISKRRLTSSLVSGSLLYAAGYAAFGGATGFWTLAGCVLVVTCGELLVAPSTLSLAANVVGPEHRGRSLGLFGSFEMIGRCLGPLLGGLALDGFAHRPWVHWLIVAVLGLAAAGGFLAVRPRISAATDRSQD